MDKAINETYVDFFGFVRAVFAHKKLDARTLSSHTDELAGFMNARAARSSYYRAEFEITPKEVRTALLRSEAVSGANIAARIINERILQAVTEIVGPNISYTTLWQAGIDSTAKDSLDALGQKTCEENFLKILNREQNLHIQTLSALSQLIEDKNSSFRKFFGNLTVAYKRTMARQKTVRTPSAFLWGLSVALKCQPSDLVPISAYEQAVNSVEGKKPVKGNKLQSPDVSLEQPRVIYIDNDLPIRSITKVVEDPNEEEDFDSNKIIIAGQNQFLWTALARKAKVTHDFRQAAIRLVRAYIDLREHKDLSRLTGNDKRAVRIPEGQSVSHFVLGKLAEKAGLKDIPLQDVANALEVIVTVTDPWELFALQKAFTKHKYADCEYDVMSEPPLFGKKIKDARNALLGRMVQELQKNTQTLIAA